MAKSKAKANAASIPGVGEEEIVDEAAEMSKTSKQARTFDSFITALREEEAKSLKPRSGDYEVLKNLSQAEIRVLQGFDEENPLAPPSPKNARLVGFQKFGTGNVCLVLKEAFKEKKESLQD